jgi:uncharacterized membrane protein YbaN (DUF454 family)
MIIRFLLIAAGTVFLILGVIGIFVPGLPTTPFLLLTAGLYLRSSDRLYQKLIRNPYVGKYITQWQATRRLSLKTKITSIILMWAMILISVLFVVDSLVLHLIIAGAGLIGTIVMGLIIPTGNQK